MPSRCPSTNFHVSQSGGCLSPLCQSKRAASSVLASRRARLLRCCGEFLGRMNELVSPVVLPVRSHFSEIRAAWLGLRLLFPPLHQRSPPVRHGPAMADPACHLSVDISLGLPARRLACECLLSLWHLHANPALGGSFCFIGFTLFPQFSQHVRLTWRVGPSLCIHAPSG